MPHPSVEGACLKSPLHRSAGIRRLGADDANAMISERRMHAGQRHLRHVAGDAILRGHRAGLARVARRAFLRARRCMASEALLVIRGDIVVQKLMRIMARDAREARVSLAPAAAAFETIRLKAHVLDALDSCYRDVVPRTVTGAAKVYLRHRPQAPWIENSLAALGILFVVHELGVFGARTMTSFAIHAEDQARCIKSRPGCGSGGVAPKATAQGVWRNGPAKRLLKVLRSLGRVARGQIQALQS